MTEGINLAEEQTTKQKKRNPFTVASVVLVVCVIVVSISLFAYAVFLKANLAALISQEDQQIQRLTALTPEKTKILTIQERLAAIQRILNNRIDMSRRFDSVVKTVPGGVQISDISTTDRGLTIRLTSDSLEALNSFLEEKLATILQDKNVKIKKIDVSGFSLKRGVSGYGTKLSFTFL